MRVISEQTEFPAEQWAEVRTQGRVKNGGGRQ